MRHDALLRVAGLTVAYGEALPAVTDVSLDVCPAEIVALLGANGAGKSTVLRAISGSPAEDRARINAETVELGGTDLRGLRPWTAARRGVSYVPERDKVFGELTVGEHIQLKRRSGNADETVVDEVRALFPELDPLWKRRAATLSGGERQMLAIAAGLASRPKILILDEVTLGLAPVVIMRLGEKLRALADERGTTILLAEQNVQLALSIANYIYVLSTGQVVGSATTASWSQERLMDAYFGGKQVQA